MKVSSTNPNEFEITELKKEDLYLIQEALIAYKHNMLKDAEAFKGERQRCVDIYSSIETEVLKSR